jgi:hypothetical protein
MRRGRLLVVLAAVLTSCALAQESPRMKSVEPANGKVGDVLTAEKVPKLIEQPVKCTVE